MKHEDKTRFAEMMKATYELFDKKITSAVLGLMWQILKRFDIEDIERAVVAHFNNPDTGMFSPKPADIVRYIEGSTETRGMQAWTKVDKAIRCVGTYASVVFDDPIIHQVIVDMGGWVDLGKKQEKELPFIAREFEKRYRGYSIQGGVSDYPKQLCGICQHENSQNNYESEPPVLIGKTEKALLVYQRGGDGVKQEYKSLADFSNQLLANMPAGHEVA